MSERSCTRCGMTVSGHEHHSDDSDCIHALSARVAELEAELAKRRERPFGSCRECAAPVGGYVDYFCPNGCLASSDSGTIGGDDE